MEEGCLSVPGIFETVSRAETIKVRAFDKYGIQFEMEADGLLAVCIQHEIEHLEGKLFVDKLSNFKQKRIIKKPIKDNEFLVKGYDINKIDILFKKIEKDND